MKKRLAIGILVCMLVLSTVAMIGCVEESGGESSLDPNTSVVEQVTTWKVHFEKCTDLVTNTIRDREIEKDSDGLLTEPVLQVMGDNPNNAELEGWYTEATYENKWNFETDKVTSDMTLYAKWSKTFKVTYHVVYDTHDTAYEDPYTMVKEGTCAEKRDSLADGYQLLGYYADAQYTTEYDFTKPVTADTEIYIKTSEGMYYNAETMNRNFSVWSANGSQEGLSKELVNNGDESYMKVNFGTKNNNLNGVHTGAFGSDNLGVLLDGSQHLVMQVKNMGDASEMFVFFAIMFDDLTWAQQGFAQYKYEFPAEQRNMTEEDEWITLELKLDELTMDKAGHGVSAWANAVKVGAFRIDCYNWDHNGDADYPTLNNVVCFKEIKGVACNKYTDPQDTVSFNDSSKEELDAVKQEAINGWNFPREYAKAEATGDTVLYNTKEGLLAYAPYGSSAIEFTLKQGELTVDRLSTVALNIKNGGYGQALKLKFHLKNATDEWTVEREISLEQGMKEFKEVLISMTAYENFAGTLTAVDFSLAMNGIDNYLLIEALEMKGYIAAELPGINFADNKFAFTASEGASIAFDFDELATNVTIEKSGASITAAEYSYPVGVYKTAELTAMANGITKITMKYSVGDAEYSVDFEPTTEYSTVKANLASGVDGLAVITGIKFEFTGEGSVSLKSLVFKIDTKRGLDFSISTYFDVLKADDRFAQGAVVEYNALTSSTKFMNADFNAATAMYIGFYGHVTGCYNIQLGAGQKIYVIYQNTSAVGGGEQPIRLFPVTTAHAENGTHPEGSYEGGYVDIQPITNMKAGEWAVGCVDVPAVFATDTLDLCKIDWRLTPHEGFSIRAIVVL